MPSPTCSADVDRARRTGRTEGSRTAPPVRLGLRSMTDGDEAPAEHQSEAPGLKPAARHSKRSLVARAVALAITGLALYVVFPSLVRVIGAWPRLATLTPGWLAGAVVLE